MAAELIISSNSVSDLESFMLFIIVSLNNIESCETKPIKPLKLFLFIFLIFIPSMDILPSETS